MKKRLLALLSAIVLMGSVSLAENTEESAETPATAEPMVSLPIDLGCAYQDSGCFPAAHHVRRRL